MSFSIEREPRMDYSALTPLKQAAWREMALRRAHELRRQAIADAWNALVRLLRRPRHGRSLPEPAGAGADCARSQDRTDTDASRPGAALA
jgi:hypothetical protein